MRSSISPYVNYLLTLHYTSIKFHKCGEHRHRFYKVINKGTNTSWNNKFAHITRAARKQNEKKILQVKISGYAVNQPLVWMQGFPKVYKNLVTIFQGYY